MTLDGHQVLLVDDDGGTDYSDAVVADLTAIGHSVAVWDVHAIDRFPTAEFLERSALVIWYLGPHSLDLPANGDSLLKQLARMRITFLDSLVTYLDGGGSLFLIGQDYLDFPPLDPTDESDYVFSSEMLYLLDHESNTLTEMLMADPGGRLGLEFGEVLLDVAMLPDTGETFDLKVDELVPDLESGAAVAEVLDADILDAVVGYTVETSRYRAVFFAFPILGFPEAERRDVLASGVVWLLANAPSLLEISGVRVEESENYPDGFSLRVNGTGFATPNGWQVYVGTHRLGNVTRLGDEELRGDMTAMPPPGVYDITVMSPGGLTAMLAEGLTVTNDGPVGAHDWILHDTQ